MKNPTIKELRARIDALERALDTMIVFANRSEREADQTIESIFELLNALEKAECADMKHLDNLKIQAP